MSKNQKQVNQNDNNEEEEYEEEEGEEYEEGEEEEDEEDEEEEEEEKDDKKNNKPATDIKNAKQQSQKIPTPTPGQTPTPTPNQENGLANQNTFEEVTFESVLRKKEIIINLVSDEIDNDFKPRRTSEEDVELGPRTIKIKPTSLFKFLKMSNGQETLENLCCDFVEVIDESESNLNKGSLSQGNSSSSELDPKYVEILTKKTTKFCIIIQKHEMNVSHVTFNNNNVRMSQSREFEEDKLVSMQTETFNEQKDRSIYLSHFSLDKIARLISPKNKDIVGISDFMSISVYIISDDTMSERMRPFNRLSLRAEILEKYSKTKAKEEAQGIVKFKEDVEDANKCQKLDIKKIDDYLENINLYLSGKNQNLFEVKLSSSEDRNNDLNASGENNANLNNENNNLSENSDIIEQNKYSSHKKFVISRQKASRKKAKSRKIYKPITDNNSIKSPCLSIHKNENLNAAALKIDQLYNEFESNKGDTLDINDEEKPMKLRSARNKLNIDEEEDEYANIKFKGKNNRFDQSNNIDKVLNPEDFDNYHLNEKNKSNSNTIDKNHTRSISKILKDDESSENNNSIEFDNVLNKEVNNKNSNYIMLKKRLGDKKNIDEDNDIIQVKNKQRIYPRIRNEEQEKIYFEKNFLLIELFSPNGKSILVNKDQYIILLLAISQGKISSENKNICVFDFKEKIRTISYDSINKDTITNKKKFIRMRATDNNYVIINRKNISDITCNKSTISINSGSKLYNKIDDDYYEVADYYDQNVTVYLPKDFIAKITDICNQFIEEVKNINYNGRNNVGEQKDKKRVVCIRLNRVSSSNISHDENE